MKKSIIKPLVFIILYALGIAHINVLFRFVCEKPLPTIMWWLSVVFIINGLMLFMLSIIKKLPDKVYKCLLIGKILFTVIGAILFIVSAFLFISNIFISILLIISVTLIFTILVLLQYWIVKQKEE